MIFHGFPSCDIDVFFQHLEKANILTRTDLAWGWFVKDHFSLSDKDLIFTTIFLSHLVSKNHICLRLDYWGGRCFPEKGGALNPLVTFEDKDKWLEKINRAPIRMITSVTEEESPSSLMVVDSDGDVYFNRYYHYQKNLARLLHERMRDNRLLIITGGPGTGKTSRVFKEIWEVKQRNPQARIALLAPTGKAASRLREAVIGAKQKQSQKKENSLTNATVLRNIPDETYTVHRFLTKMAHSASPAWRADWDLVVVDEASMISFPLFYELLTVIRDAVQLILLGDKDQLSSVEEGSLFYDLADNSQTRSPLNRHIHCLEKNYRYPEDSRIAQAAAAIRNSGEKGYKVFMRSLCKDILSHPQRRDIEKYDLIYFSDYDRQKVEMVWMNFFRPRYQEVFSEVKEYLQSQREGIGVDGEVADPQRDRILHSLFDLHKDQIILCARRKGMWGMETMNHLVGEWLRDLRVESQTDFSKSFFSYNKMKLGIGDPLIVNHNRYELELYNGDIGVVFPVWSNGNWVYRVFFEDSEGGYREHLPEVLGELDRAYALTVHKSQGSEFARVMVLMGDENNFLTREICYTALTRAREKVFFFMEEKELQRSLSRVGVCHSGLRKYLLKAIWGKERE